MWPRAHVLFAPPSQAPWRSHRYRFVAAADVRQKFFFASTVAIVVPAGHLAQSSSLAVQRSSHVTQHSVHSRAADPVAASASSSAPSK